MLTNRHQSAKIRFRYAGRHVLRLCLIVLLISQVIAAQAGEMSKRQSKRPAQENRRLNRQEVRAAEQKLAELGYWTGKVDGVFDSSSRHALIAFQKVEGRKPRGVLTRAEYDAIAVAAPPLPRESHYEHVEVDLRRQVLFRVDGEGKVSHILPISSGNGEWFTSEGFTRRAVTPPGRFTVYYQIKGWRKSPLGLLYYPNYFLSGVAIHGNPAVPTRPASHGCVRIPMFASEEFSRLTPIGTKIFVYDPAPVTDHPTSRANNCATA